MYGYTLTTKRGDHRSEIMVGASSEQGFRAFARMILAGGLPDEGDYFYLTNYWDADGRQGFTGQMSRQVISADHAGLFDTDGSGAASAVAVGARRAREWANDVMDIYAASAASRIRFEETTPNGARWAIQRGDTRLVGTFASREQAENACRPGDKVVPA